MKKNLLTLSFLAFGLGSFAQAKLSFDDKAKAYVKQYGAWAIEEQQRVGIPASITLAQGIYETGAGESELATQANNHFGIKCKKEWRGATFAHTDDAPNECFRKYPTAKDSYKDHSDYLKNSARYAELFTFDKLDYKSWAKGLKKCGYATNPAYAQKLIKMVEDYDLQMYTFAAEGKRQNEVIPAEEATLVSNMTVPTVTTTQVAESSEEAASSDGSVRINDIRAVYCIKGETLLDKAMKYNIRYARLLEMNELTDEPLKRDMYVYLEPKKSKGAHPTYLVKEGETVEIIAHNEGMNSRQLRIFNLMAQNEQPDAGSVLKLQEQANERPGTYKMKKETQEQPSQSISLIDPNAPAKQDDFLPTKKGLSKPDETEVEIGFGVVPPSEQKATMLKQSTPLKSTVQQSTISTQSPAAKVENVNNTQQTEPITKPKLESEIAAQNDAGDLPQTLEPEQAPDELALLKAKLDKAVYARSSKSNIKVSSEDSSALYSHSATVAKAATPQADPKTNTGSSLTHTVVKGDTGYSIAKKYGISVKQLNEMNQLNFDGIKIGQKLRVK